MIIFNRTNRFGVASIAAFAVAGAVACSSSSSPSGSAPDSSTPESDGESSSSSSSSGGSIADTGTPPVDSGSEATTLGDGASEATTPADGGEAGTSEAGGATALTVMNFLTWCSVTINGGSASTLAVITASLPVGSTATIIATPKNASFVIGNDPWFGVSQNDGGAAPGTDEGSGVTETSTATVVVGGLTQCVSVCCGDAPNGTNCPTTNPCL